jgi:hypothetical protein
LCDILPGVEDGQEALSKLLNTNTLKRNASQYFLLGNKISSVTFLPVDFLALGLLCFHQNFQVSYYDIYHPQNQCMSGGSHEG